jgi:hypothetical protein
LPTHDRVTANTVHCAQEVVRAWHRLARTHRSTQPI